MRDFGSCGPSEATDLKSKLDFLLTFKIYDFLLIYEKIGKKVIEKGIKNNNQKNAKN